MRLLKPSEPSPVFGAERSSWQGHWLTHRVSGSLENQSHRSAPESMPQNCPDGDTVPRGCLTRKKGPPAPHSTPTGPMSSGRNLCCSPCQQNGSHQEACPSPHLHGRCNGLWAPRPYASNCRRIWDWLSGFFPVNVGLIKLEFPNSIKDRFKSCWIARERGDCFTQPLVNPGPAYATHQC